MMRSIRLLPLVILSAALLLGLKTAQWVGLAGSPLTGVQPVIAQSLDEPMDAGEQEDQDTAMDGMDAAPMAAGEDMQSADAMMASSEDSSDQMSVDQVDLPAQTSREQLLERLGERRVAIDEREQDLRVREQLLEAAERRLEQRMAELAALEARVLEQADAEEEREREEIARLVQVYTAMRPKDAAAIFDLLDLPILMEVANAMNPRKMADILGEMTPESARRLTIALAGSTPRLVVAPEAPSGGLPQIEGVPVQ